MSYNRIIFTGQSGLRPDEKKLDISQFYSEFFNKNYQFLKLEDLVKEEFKKKKNIQNPSTIWLGTFLQESPRIIIDQWKNAVKKASKILSVRKNYIIALHAVYYNNRTLEYIIPVSESCLKELKPQVFITLIDDIYDIHLRLRENGHIFNKAHGGSDDPKGVSFELFRILDWRAREIMVTRHLAEELKAKHYVFAIKHNGETLRSLIEENKPTCYVSHPITYVRKLQAKGQKEKAEEIVNEIHNFEEEVSKEFTAFLPTTIDELRIKKNKLVNNVDCLITDREKRWDEDKYDNPSNMMFRKPDKKDIDDPLWNENNIKNESLGNVLEIIAKVINTQIDVRDHIMVEQSDVLMVYRPCYDGEVSRGVLEELNYFGVLENKRKKCLMYLPIEDENNLKIKQFIANLEKQVKESPWNKKHTESIALNDEQRKKLLDAYGDREKFDLFFSELFDEFGLQLVLEDTALSKDRIVRSKEIRQEFIDKYFNVVDELLNTYYSNADKKILKLTSHKKIVAKLNTLF